MSQTMNVEFTLFEGPSLAAPFAAVVAAFDCPFPAPMEGDELRRLLAAALPADAASAIRIADGAQPFEVAAAACASGLQDLLGACDLPLLARRTEADRCTIALGHHDPQAGAVALNSGIQLAAALFAGASATPEARQGIAGMLSHVRAVLAMHHPDYITRAMLRAARARDIPAMPVAPGSRIWQYGQGAASLHGFEVANERDSLTGARMAHDKYVANQLVTRLGFPGVSHGLANDLASATEIARRLGYPVVVKPIGSGKGSGVTAEVGDEEELRGAFAAAERFSPGRVIVERQIIGDDHRIAVIGGQFRWCVRRSPPRVIGDGRSTLAALIEAENERRADDIARGFLSRIVVDEEVQRMLKKQRLGLDDRVPFGTSVRLRAIANTATGGTITECSAEVHADNRAMAEAIARGFRLDSIGIDFLTTDVARSWRDSDCGVIELNTTPGFSSDARAELILAARFPPGSDGRIPSVVTIGADPALAEAIARSVQALGLAVGRTEAARTELAGNARCPSIADLPGRVRALLLDPACELLLAHTDAALLSRHGFPLERCHLALIAGAAALDAPLRALVERCAFHVIDPVDAATLEGEVTAALAALPRPRLAGLSH